MLKKGANGKWLFSNTIEGADFSAYKLAFDSLGQLWVVHPKKGLYRISLDPFFKKAQKIVLLGAESGLPSEFNLDLATIGDDIILKSDSLFFSWDEKSGRFKQIKTLGNTSLQPGNFQLIGGRQGEWFQVFPNYTSFHNGRVSKLRISLIIGNERIIPLDGLGYLFCLDDGYAIMPYQQKGTMPQNALPPFITKIEIGQNLPLDEPLGLPQPLRLMPSSKQIRFFYASPNFTFRPSMRTRLLGFEEKWSAFQSVYAKEYTNLSPGQYEFQVQGEESEAHASFRFVIEPHWYQGVWALIGYALLLMGLAWLLLHWHSRRMKLQMWHLQKEKEKELEQQRVKANNEMLQAEVLNKNRKLADSTMELIRKNEMLQSIKNNLTKLETSKDTDRYSKAIRQLNHMIDSHLSSEEDWKVFESNFNQLHDQFFKRLKDLYPDLTPGDLRLAAYLKMNLSSKEIAPLLNISLRGVENKRYRLRKKLNIDADDNLTEMLMKF